MKHYLKDPEFKFYAFILGSVSLITVVVLAADGSYGSLSEAMRRGVFQVVSFVTITYATADFNSWPLFLPYVLLYAAISAPAPPQPAAA